MQVFLTRIFLTIFVIFAVSSFADATDRRTSDTARKKVRQPLKITVVPVGPTQRDADAARDHIEKSAIWREALRNTKHHLMSLGFAESKVTRESVTRYRATYYDYTNNRTFIFDGDLSGSEPVTIRESAFQPSVSTAELSDAFALVAADPEFGPLYREKRITPSAAMPPISTVDGDRIVNVGIKYSTGEFKIIGVRLGNASLLRYQGEAPATARAAPAACGIADANQGSTFNGTPGQAMLTVTDGASTLWEMMVVRPSASSGNQFERSGVEIRDVKYKGKSVLKRGHVPVLNVQYANNACGPFRDWQWQEGPFVAPEAGSINPADGIRVLADGQIATTSIETGNDSGNFRGVAIYKQNTKYGQEVVMVSEMDAGWYRYIMEWRFAPDGTIRPRFGFGSVENSCVCITHFHHAYWRLDFDVVTSANKVFQNERGRRFLQPLLTETKVTRNYATNRSIVIQNGSGNEAVSIVPSLTDGRADTFSRGDFWITRFQGTANDPLELDDPNPGSSVLAELDPWINGESLQNHDVVVWYAGHYSHDEHEDHPGADSPQILSGSHVIGPDIRLIRW